MRTAQEVIDFNRRAKAEKIARAIITNGLTRLYKTAETDEQWSLAAELAGYKKGTKVSPECRGLVTDFLQHPEKISKEGA